jgi:MFS family permease
VEQRERKPLWGLLIGNGISLIGSAVSAIAIPWYVLETTGSAARVGLVAFFVALPMFASGILGGPLIDRAGFRRMSIAADLLSGVCIAAIPAIDDLFGIAFWQLLVLVLLAESLTVPGITARRSLLPDLARQGGMRLTQANSWFESLQRVSQLLGPPLAGVIVATMGAKNALWIDGASFAVSATAVALFVPATRAMKQGVRGRYREQIGDGLRFIRNDRLLLNLMLTLAVVNAFSSPFYSVLLPVFAKDAWNSPQKLGLLFAASGAGAVLGGLLYGGLAHRFSRRWVWSLGFLILPLDFWPMLVTTRFFPLLVVFVVTAFVSGPLNTLLVTVRHERIPEVLRGRVFAASSAIAGVAQPIGMLLGGWLAERFGVREAIFVMAVFLQLLGVWVLFSPRTRELDQPAPTLQEEPELAPVET